MDEAKMKEIARKQAELIPMDDNGLIHCSVVPYMLAAMRETVAAERKDAERYRWLRDKGFDRVIQADTASQRNGLGPYVTVNLPGVEPISAVLFGEYLDHNVDAAIRQPEAGTKE